MPLTYAVFCFEYRNIGSLENDDDILNELLNIMASFIPTWHTPFIFQVLKAQEIIFSNSKMGCEDYFFLYESASHVGISSGNKEFKISIHQNFFTVR